VWKTFSCADRFKIYSAINKPVTFSPDGKRIVCDNSRPEANAFLGPFFYVIKVFDAGSGAELLRISPDEEPRDTAPDLLLFSPDGKRLLAATSPPTIWDSVSGQKLLSLNGHSGTVVAGAFTTDGKRIATAGQDGTIRLWDYDSGQELFSISTATPQQFLLFCDQGRKLISADAHGVITIWDASRKMPIERAESATPATN
jgi:WD40 repeat protein